ncbi:histidine phosphatase family protein [bacterium]|nr:histidine phosphatase family protein [bacterium]MCI0605448.1 histidine phosphatase family protein [bacterium]
MARFILIRHGETDWNLEGRYQGQSDVPLNERGRRQSEELAVTLRESMISNIYCSDLIRASESAEILSRALGLVKQEDPRLREIHLGSWEGMLFAEIQAKYSELLKMRKLDPRTVSAPGGETLEQVRVRVMASVTDILERHPNETSAIVSHGLPLAILIACYRGRSLREVWDLIPENSNPIETPEWNFKNDWSKP